VLAFSWHITTTLYIMLFILLQGYTNADNPFGDEHLLDTFVWQKKLEKEGKSDLAQAELEKIQKTKMMESKVQWLFYMSLMCVLLYCLY